MLIHAANDYDVTAGNELGAELQRRYKAHVLKIYPAVGKTPDDGHNQVYTSFSEWETDVFRFLDENVRPEQGASPVHLGHLSWRDLRLPTFGNPNLSLCVVDTGNPVCYRLPVIHKTFGRTCNFC